MPNPTPGILATGKYVSRGQLAGAVCALHAQGKGWTEIAASTGISPRTVKRIFEGEQLKLKNGREQAYQLVRETTPPVEVPAPPALPPRDEFYVATPAPTSGFKGAVALYVAAGLVLLALVVVLINHR